MRQEISDYDQLFLGQLYLIIANQENLVKTGRQGAIDREKILRFVDKNTITEKPITNK